MKKASYEAMQQAISKSSKEHSPVPYSVNIKDKQGELLRTVYVRASSKHRAELTGLREAWHTFGESKAADASASPYPNEGIIEWANKRNPYWKQEAA